MYVAKHNSISIYNPKYLTLSNPSFSYVYNNMKTLPIVKLTVLSLYTDL